METGTNATGLYTEEQINQVAAIKDEDLRDNLLHQLRLRDNMERDRNAFEQMIIKAGLKDKIIIDCEEMRNDKSEGSYYYGWQANIAMAFYDEHNKWKELHNNDDPQPSDVHEIANNAAKNFLNLLIK